MLYSHGYLRSTRSDDRKLARDRRRSEPLTLCTNLDNPLLRAARLRQARQPADTLVLESRKYGKHQRRHYLLRN